MAKRNKNVLYKRGNLSHIIDGMWINKNKFVWLLLGVGIVTFWCWLLDQQHASNDTAK